MRTSFRMSTPRRTNAETVNVTDAVMLIVGIVIGAGIFALPPMVAANTGTGGGFLFAWVIGGVVSLAGALCYAELATAHPNAGGEHHFLRRAFGPSIGFLFAWARLAVLQTGSIAIQAYIVGDYLMRLLPPWEHGPALIAAGSVAVVTGVNVVGFRHGKRVQLVLALATTASVLLVAAAGIFGAPPLPVPAVASEAGTPPAFGLAMVFVLLAYGGWNEAAYVSADVARRGIVRALVWGIAVITVIYLLINVAYLRGLGLTGLIGSTAPAADLVQRVLGPEAAALVSVTIAIAALSTMNATTITGGRSHFALGRDVPLFQRLGEVDAEGTTPRAALLVQGAIALLLVVFGAFMRNAFVGLVEFTAPVFWFFIFLVGVSVFVLRRRSSERNEGGFRVPLYPLTPLLFCAMCLYMIKSSLEYTGIGALVGVGVLVAGLPVLWLARGRRAGAQPLVKRKEILP